MDLFASRRWIYLYGACFTLVLRATGTSSPVLPHHKAWQRRITPARSVLKHSPLRNCPKLCNAIIHIAAAMAVGRVGRRGDSEVGPLPSLAASQIAYRV